MIFSSKSLFLICFLYSRKSSIFPKSSELAFFNIKGSQLIQKGLSTSTWNQYAKSFRSMFVKNFRWIILKKPFILDELVSSERYFKFLLPCRGWQWRRKAQNRCKSKIEDIESSNYEQQRPQTSRSCWPYLQEVHILEDSGVRLAPRWTIFPYHQPIAWPEKYVLTPRRPIGEVTPTCPICRARQFR